MSYIHLAFGTVLKSTTVHTRLQENLQFLTIVTLSITMNIKYLPQLCIVHTEIQHTVPCLCHLQATLCQMRSPQLMYKMNFMLRAVSLEKKNSGVWMLTTT